MRLWQVLAFLGLVLGLTAWCLSSYCLLSLLLPPVPLYVPALAVVGGLILAERVEHPWAGMVLMLSLLWLGVEIVGRFLPPGFTVPQLTICWSISGLVTVLGFWSLTRNRRRKGD